ncbi:hypothetical protein CLV24_10437 [Pontibacter ummariensis]|nr:hypothetical protein CLV24_10437 [Pontibacter ummariensis]
MKAYIVFIRYLGNRIIEAKFDTGQKFARMRQAAFQK